MSNCFKDLYDYELVETCHVCKTTFSMSNFYKNISKNVDLDLCVKFVVSCIIMIFKIDY